MPKEWRKGMRDGSNSSSNSDSFDDDGNYEGQNKKEGGGDGHFFPGGLDDEEEDEDSSSEEEPGFFVKVETIMGSQFEVYAYPSDNVELLKTRIAFQEGIPQKDQNLFLSHGRISLNNPTALLSDLGLNEVTSRSRPLRLITNISSGMGSKGFVSRASSPPPPPHPLYPPQLPLLPNPYASGSGGGGVRRDRGDPNSSQVSANGGSISGRRNSQGQNQGSELFRLPRLGPGLEDDDIDGVIIFKNFEERRVYVIIKKNPSAEALSSLNFNPTEGQRSTSTMTSETPRTGVEQEFERIRCEARLRGSAAAAEATRIFGEDLVRRREIFTGKREDHASIEAQKQFDRIKENAKTLKKMKQIRKDLLLKKKIFLDSDYKKSFQNGNDDGENHLPSILQKDYNFNLKEKKLSVNFQNKDEEDSKCIFSQFSKPNTARMRVKEKSIPDYNRTITSSIASLNRLKAEIYLEAKKTGGGSLGIAPYTDLQLLKYAQLKVKVLLAAQNPVDYDYLSPHRFVPHVEPKTLIPTVVINMEQQDKAMQNGKVPRSGKNPKNGKKTRNGLISGGQKNNRVRDSSTSTCASDVSVLKEKTTNNISRLVSARNLKSDDSLRSGRLRRQKSQTTLIQHSGGVSGRSNRSSAGKRPLSGSTSVSGTNTTIQKKKKDNVRCAECRKRIGVSCRYQCRCGKMFCSTHRYAETHNCTYDYKSEGRRQITEANPLIVASKVDKI